MLSESELAQMKADAERIEALRQNATGGPWEAAIGGPESGYMYDVLCPHRWEFYEAPQLRTLLQLNWNFPENIANDRNFIAATRTDPSAANVLRLLEEVERLREIAKRNIPHPSYLPMAFNRAHFERLGSILQRIEGEKVIDTCHIHGVPVPEHLKPYEKGGDA